MGCSASTSVGTVNPETPSTVTASLNGYNHNNHHNHFGAPTTPIKAPLPPTPTATLTPTPPGSPTTTTLPAHIFYGGPGLVADQTLGPYLLATMRKHADAGLIAQLDADSDVEWSFADLLAHSVRVARALEEIGLGPGDTVAFFSRNYHELFSAVLGALMAGTTVAAMVPTNTVPEMVHQLRLVKPRILMTEPALLPVAKGALALFTLPIILISLLSSPDVPDDVQTLDFFSGSNAESETDVASYNAVTIPNPEENVAFILYSSGTTGLPKGVRLPNLGLLQLCINVRDFANKSDQTCLATSPMSWVSGVYILLCGILVGLKRVFVPAINEVKLVRTILQRQIKRWVSAPPILMALSANANVPPGLLSSVTVLVGGGPMTKEMHDTAHDRLGGLLLGVYGSTEGGFIFMNREDENKPGSLGVVQPTVTVKVVDLDTEEDVTEPNVVGELRIKGPCVMKGYIGNPVATAEAFDANGWLRSGDLVYFSEDGEFYYVDRMKEMIKYRSYQVAPTEVENVLLQHPGVQDACVLGRPHDIDGEWPTAFVVLTPDSQATAAELQALVAEKLSDAKKLRGGVIFLDTIPRTTTGKTMRKELKALLSKYPPPEPDENEQ